MWTLTPVDSRINRNVMLDELLLFVANATLAAQVSRRVGGDSEQPDGRRGRAPVQRIGEGNARKARG